MSLMFVLLAALCAASVNFCLRKNFEHQKSALGYLALYFLFSFVTSFVFRFELNFQAFSYVMSSVGVVAGILNMLMMLFVARAVQIGPSGLTFAFQNSASMFPALLLFFLFGASFGFHFHTTLLIGFCCLVLGLFLSVRHEKTGTLRWLILALAIFFIQGIILSIFQWRSLLFEVPVKPHFLIPWTCSTQEDMWFMPGFFILPAIIQSVLFFLSERRWFTSKEILLGTIAGVLNAGATFCLLMAARDTHSPLRAVLFPIFAVAVIFLCNLWGKRFYQERINWKATALCIGGVLIGSFQ